MAITLEQMTVAFAKMVEMQTDLLEKMKAERGGGGGVDGGSGGGKGGGKRS